MPETFNPNAHEEEARQRVDAGESEAIVHSELAFPLLDLARRIEPGSKLAGLFDFSDINPYEL